MSYIICFWDRSKLQISNEVGEKLKNAIQNNEIKTFVLNESLYMISGIEKIIPKEEAYDIFPNEWELLKGLNDKSLTSKLLSSGKNK